MNEKAGIDRSLNAIYTELQYLREHGIVTPPQFGSIMAQLPQNGFPSQYTDSRFGQGNIGPSAIAQAAQDPNNPANPKHPHHLDWAKKLGDKFGNAAVWGAGSTAGADLANSIFKQL